MGLTRRGFLESAGALGLVALLPRARLIDLVEAATQSASGSFLDAHRMATLRALTARFIPGPLDGIGPLNTPPQTDPGAREGHCAEAIDILLAAFMFDPPLIHAGGPFSNRAGHTVDDFAAFVPLDSHAALGWRIRLEGTRGIKEREFAGPVVGLQEIYTTGLDGLDARARALFSMDFAHAGAVRQDAVILASAASPLDSLNAFIATAFANTTDAMYGPPEYGGNAGLVGWRTTGFEGDVQPRGFTAAQVSGAGPGTVLDASAARGLMPLLDAIAGRPASRTQPWLARPGGRWG